MFSHGFQMVRVRRINNGFIGLNGFFGCLQGGALVSSAPTEYMNAVCFVGAAETAAPPGG